MIGSSLEEALIALCLSWALVGGIRAVRDILRLFGVIEDRR